MDGLRLSPGFRFRLPYVSVGAQRSDKISCLEHVNDGGVG